MTGIVLAGGKSERMGVPKATLKWNGGTFLEHAVALLRPFCEDIIIAVQQGQPLPAMANCKIVVDEQPGLGPLGGLVASLAASKDDWHLTLACDLPLVRSEVLHLLCENAQGVDAVVPLVGGRLQPLVAAYARACLEPGREALQTGARALRALLDRVRVKVLEEDELRKVDPELVSFTNVNTWEEYQDILSNYIKIRRV